MPRSSAVMREPRLVGVFAEADAASGFFLLDAGDVAFLGGDGVLSGCRFRGEDAFEEEEAILSWIDE